MVTDNKEGNTNNDGGVNVQNDSVNDIMSNEYKNKKDMNTFSELDHVKIATYIDNLCSHQQPIRQEGFRNQDKIAKVQGPTRTREELIPYIHEFVDDYDEIQLVLVDKQLEMVELIGGYEYLYAQIEPLETLAGNEEVAIRERVMYAIQEICKVMTPQQVVNSFVPMYHHLSCSEWFTARQSACTMFPLLYPFLPKSILPEIYAIYSEQCDDYSPIVRRTACQKLVTIANLLDDPEYIDEIGNLFIHFTKDEQDSIRQLSVSACPSVIQALYKTNHVYNILPSLYSLFSDKSWRVRYIVANEFATICRTQDNNNAGLNIEGFIHTYVKQSNDGEAEVRAAAASRITDMAEQLGGEKTIKYLQGCMKNQSQDSCDFVRAALARCVMKTSSVLSKRDIFDSLIPIFFRLLRDANSDVRLNLIVDQSSIEKAVSKPIVENAIVPAICQLAVDKNWRVRLTLIEQVPKIVEQLGKDFYERRMSDQIMVWIGDQIASIREASAENLVKITKLFGADWSIEYVLPRLEYLVNRKSYQYRLLAAKTLSQLVPIFGHVKSLESILPTLLVMQKSEMVANVRVAIVAAFYEIGLLCPSDCINKTILPILQKEMEECTDSELRFFTTQKVEQQRALLCSMDSSKEVESTVGSTNNNTSTPGDDIVV